MARDYEIIVGDCMDALRAMPDNHVDVVIYSPPYNIDGGKKPSGMYTESSVKMVGEWYDTHGDNMDESKYWAWQNDVLAESLRVSKGLVWVNHQVRYKNKQAIHPVRMLDAPIYSEVIWSRPGSLTLNARKFAPSHEYIIGFGVPSFWNDESNCDFTVWRIRPEYNVPDHPCPFPVEIPARLIVASCPNGGNVLDPFAGSGSTGVAAMQNNANFVGIELSETYADLARRRIDAERNQTRLF